jgi:exonuclease VII small subunit
MNEPKGPSYDYSATLINVIDGDTIELRVSLGFEIYSDMRVRLLGVNCPELHGPNADAGQRAKNFAQPGASRLGQRGAHEPRRNMTIRETFEATVREFGRQIGQLESDNDGLRQSVELQRRATAAAEANRDRLQVQLDALVNNPDPSDLTKQVADLQDQNAKLERRLAQLLRQQDGSDAVDPGPVTVDPTSTTPVTPRGRFGRPRT